MALHPKTTADLRLAPVAAEIDLNLQYIRNKSGHDLAAEVGLQLNQESPAATRDARAAQILGVAVRDVNLHGWSAEITDDDSRLHLSGGSVTLDVGLSTDILRYIAG